MKKLKIRDVRFGLGLFDLSILTSLKNMLSDTGHNYLSKVNYQFEVKNTNVLKMSVLNIDREQEVIATPYRLGDIKFDNIGSAVCFLSENYFLSLSDEGKRLYLAEHIHKTFTNYARYFNEDTKLLDQAYTRLLEKDGFYRKNFRPEQSPDKKYSCWLESIINYKSKDYRICCREEDTNTVSYHFLTNKPERDPKALRQMDIIELLKVPMLFKSEGWINNQEFKVRWGEVGSEVYLFNAQTKEIRTHIEDIETPF